MLMSRRRNSMSSRRDMLVMSLPSISIVPDVGSIRRFRRRSRVDLPEPDRPMITKISPALMSKLALWTPTKAPVSAWISDFVFPARTILSASSVFSPKIL